MDPAGQAQQPPSVCGLCHHRQWAAQHILTGASAQRKHACPCMPHSTVSSLRHTGVHHSQARDKLALLQQLKRRSSNALLEGTGFGPGPAGTRMIDERVRERDGPCPIVV